MNDDINAVRLAWIRRRMRFREGSLNLVLHVFRELDSEVSNITHDDLNRSVSDLALRAGHWRKVHGYGVTEPGYKGPLVVRLGDLIDIWMLGL